MTEDAGMTGMTREWSDEQVINLIARVIAWCDEEEQIEQVYALTHYQDAAQMCLKHLGGGS